MSYKAVKIEKNLTRTFLVTERADIDEDKLPNNTTLGTNGLTKIDNDKVAIGSKAVCSADWTRWILTPDNEWKEVPSSGGSGGSGDSGDTDFDIITDEEIDDIIGGLS